MLYGVFFTAAATPGGPAIDYWAIGRAKRTAIRYAKSVGGYVVRVSGQTRGPWDAPTFRAVGDRIADFRRSGVRS